MSFSAGAAPAPSQATTSSDTTSTAMPTTTTTTTATLSPADNTTACAQNTHPSGHHRPAASRTSIDTTGQLSVHSQASHQEYLDRLVVPSQGELERIAEIQQNREADLRRRSREQKQSRRRSLEACDRAAAVAAITSNGSLVHHKSANSIRSSIHGTGDKEDSKSKKASHGDERSGFFSGLDAIVARARAATVIQRHYRGYRARREMNGLSINANTRWVDAIREARYRELTRPRARAELELPAGHMARIESHDSTATATASGALRNWKKATEILKHASLDQDTDSDANGDNDDDDPDFGDDVEGNAENRQKERQRASAARVRRRKEALIMGLQYFLEMIDVKHRYGANLRVYHEEWKRSDTKENFFYWLDYGEGRLIDTAACPRERLDREQVRYLSREERQYYQVKIDKEGRLCWAKNGVRIDTTVKYKDSIHGIVPVDDPTPAFKPATPGVDHAHQHSHHHHYDSGSESSDDDSDSDSDVSESELVAARAAKYTIPDSDEVAGEPPASSASAKNAMVKKTHHFSATTVFDTLMRKSMQKNTWLFVADTSFRLYVGLKDSGTFQHSSFLQGARISAAGLIKIRNGRLVALSPLSGHYRPSVSNFRAFLRSLREEGADMKHLSISKACVVLFGLETYMRTRQRGKKLLQKLSLHSHGHDHDHDHDHKGTENAAATAAAAPSTATAPAATTTGRLLQNLHIPSVSHRADEAVSNTRT